MLSLSDTPSILYKALLIQLSRIRISVAVNDIASVAYNKPGRQEDYNNSAVTSSEFAPLFLLYIQLKAGKNYAYMFNTEINLSV